MLFTIYIILRMSIRERERERGAIPGRENKTLRKERKREIICIMLT